MTSSPLSRRLSLLLGFPLAIAGWSALHFELLSSYPRKDQVLASAPVEISLIFSESADSARSSISLSGPAGPVPLGPVRVQDEKLVLLARVEGPMPAGAYTITWASAAPLEDPIRGQIRFSLRSNR